MQHRYNDQVVLVRGKFESPALVVQSVMYGTEEHLTLVSLDPEKASPLLSGMNVDAAIQRDFVTPLTNGKTYGWKEAPTPTLPVGGEPSEESGEQANAPALTAEEIDRLAKEWAQKYFNEKGAELDARASALRPTEELQADNELLKIQLTSAEEEIRSLHSKITEMEAILNQAPEPAPQQQNAAEQSTEIKVPVPEGDTNLLDPKVIAEEVKHGQEQNAAEQLDEAQGPVQPGDPESPHWIDTPADPQP